MRIGRNVQIRPLGGGVDYLAMIFFSVIASVLLTVEVSVLARFSALQALPVPAHPRKQKRRPR